MNPAHLIDAADCELLLRLLELPTIGPLERRPTDPPPELWEAQRAYAEAAGKLGFTVVHHAAARPADVAGDEVPLAVRRAVAADPGFLEAQPSLVLRLGPALPRAATVMFNVHLDTVTGLLPVDFDGSGFRGRGAIDAKGPAAALLAGIRGAIAAEPAIGTGIGVLIQAVSGEEGGAMGTIGTRLLVERGYVGRLNLFCEPTDLRYLPRATATMTACVRVAGRDATDDRPERGHNATVLLGFLAAHLGRALAPRADGARVCIAGLRTGPLHNRVYGSGTLLVNLSYATTAAGRRLESTFAAVLAEGLAEFAVRYAGSPDLALTASEAAAVTSVGWLKRGLPTLDASDPWCEAMLEDDARIDRWPDAEPAFTCDAIWMDGVPGTYTAVFGPGDLGRNNAHAADEFADVLELAAFARHVAEILVAFARRPGPG